jgi:L-asparaginase/Glu-tRNA(Gln) amidotransferase subunit D
MYVKPCPECGTPLDEIPFKDCKTHQTFHLDSPNLTDEEWEDLLAFEAAEALLKQQ